MRLKTKKDIISFVIGAVIGIALGLAAVNSWTRPTVEASNIRLGEYMAENRDVETLVYGVDPETDFVPGMYFDPTEVIEKHIEATAYCHGTTTFTGKPVRVGYAAMAEEYIGMTAAVYEETEEGRTGELIVYYEIQDTGGDYRIQNGECIDIYIPDYDEAIQFGRKK